MTGSTNGSTNGPAFEPGRPVAAWGSGAAIMALALLVNLGLFVGMEAMTRSERLLLNESTPSIPIDFLRVAMKPESEQSRRYREPPPPQPQVADNAIPQVEVVANPQALAPMPHAIALTRITPGLDAGGARLAAGRLGAGGGGATLSGTGAMAKIPFVEESALTTLIRTAPFYPPSAQQRRIEGTVVVSLRINQAGRVEDPAVVSSDPAGVFDQAALSAITQWRFKPEVRNGEPIAVRTRIRFVFRLQGSG